MQRSNFRALLLLALLLLSALPISAQVRTANGLVRGVSLPSGIQIFRGIPFAAPPVRELRWKAPQPAASWEGVRAADRFGPQCMQARIYSDMVFRNDGTSEDCLYLNVWTPSPASTARLPVLVYFYGGGFQAGDGSEPRYDGESMAKKGMVVVTMSYRLGIFGFFSHPELTAESPNRASGNYGLMDQTAALRWVRANIANFGGDPARVTIAGESAGSFSVSAQMASPLAKELIAGAIGESGSLLAATLDPLATSEQKGVAFATAVGAANLAALRAMSSFEILDAASRQGVPRFSTNVDGYFFTEHPAATYAAGRQARIPLLAGWNSEERGGRSIVQDPTPEAFSAALARIFGESAGDAARVFPAATP
jgi:para-nitrobenzyl esterase